MRGHLVRQQWEPDPSLHAPRKHRRPCSYDAFVPDSIAGLEMTFEPKFLRFFQARFRPLPETAMSAGESGRTVPEPLGRSAGSNGESMPAEPRHQPEGRSA